MSLPEAYVVLNSVLSLIEPNSLPDEAIEQLALLLSEDVVFAALDLIDHNNVIKIVAPWGRTYYEVCSSSSPDSWIVTPNLPSSPTIPAFCTCPAFINAVLIVKSHLMCKHVLAVQIARRLARCVERLASKNEFAAFLARHYSSTEGLVGRDSE